MLTPFLRLTLLICLSTVLWSCECGPDIELGQIPLAEASRAMMAHDSTQTLIFLDSAGQERRFSYASSRISSAASLPINILCEESLLDNQMEYYRTEREEIQFQEVGTENGFGLSLYTMFEEKGSVDSIALYDILSLSLWIKDQALPTFNLITTVHQSEVSQAHRQDLWQEARFIGDTSLQGKTYQEVYQSSVGPQGQLLLYNAEDGLLALVFSPENTWLRKD